MAGIEKFIESVCVQPAVYWEPKNPDGFGGIEYHPPVEILVRWETESRVITAMDGKLIEIKGSVLLTEELKVEGLMSLGSLTDFSPLQLNDPASIPGVSEVVLFNKIPLLRSKDEFVRTAYVGTAKGG